MSAYGEGVQPGTGRRTLYSEVGVKEAASSEEVRAAYLLKAKEIHPDKVPEGPDREDAERRMTRLNAVMEVLGDEEKRAAYDSDLRRQRTVEEAGLRKVAIAASLQVWKDEKGGPVWKRWWAYAGVGLVCLVLGWVTAVLLSDSRETQWWQVQNNRPAEVTTAPVEKTKPIAKPAVGGGSRVEHPALDPIDTALLRVGKAPAPNAAPQQLADQSTVVSPLVEEARRAMLRKQEAAPARPVAMAAPAPLPANPAPSTPIEVSRPPAVETPAVASTPPSHGGWDGNWKYVPALGGGVGGSFHPVSIMVQMHTTGQKVRGFYKGKYQVDRKYSAQVEFFFEGWADSGDNLSGVWKDATGARGEFALKKMDGKVVEMNWWTTAFARKGALANGAARLIEMR